MVHSIFDYAKNMVTTYRDLPPCEPRKKQRYIIRWGSALGKKVDWYVYTAYLKGGLWQFNGYYIHIALKEFESSEKMGYGK